MNLSDGAQAAGSPGERRRVVETAMGQVSYLDSGGSGAVLVFLHGTLANANTWRKLTPLLASRFRCVQPDLPLGAHHLPIGDGVDLTPPGIADLLERFLEALGLDEVVLVGNDTGGAYAQVYAVAYPSRLRGLLLSNTDCLEIFPPEQFAAMPRFIGVPGYCAAMAALFRIKRFAAGPSVLGLLSHSLTPDEIRSLYLANFIERPEIRPNLRSVARGWSPRHTQDAAVGLAAGSLPTRICWGGDDELFPLELGERLADAIPHADLVVIESARTYVHEDQPERFAAELERFVDSLL